MERKGLIYICCGVAIGFLVVMMTARHNVETPPVVNGNHTPSAPSRMLQMGPVLEGMVSSKTMGSVTVTMEASRVWFKKTKLLGFDNALFKKLEAKDFLLTVLKDGEKRLSISKDRLEMPPDKSIIEIRNPRILFPADMQQPDSITLDNGKMILYFRTGDDEMVWNLKT
jgi:hypothetical protein